MSSARTLLSALALAAFASTAPAAAQVTGDWNEYKLLPAPPKGQAPGADLPAAPKASPGAPAPRAGDGTQWDFNKDSTFVLGDGTKTGPKTPPDGKFMIKKLPGAAR